MSPVYVEDLVEYVTLLERELGHKANYKILDPTPALSSDCASIELLAFSISKFIGLEEYKFEISISKKEKNVAGSINLKHYGKTVQIEISEQVLESTDKILAILAHEITHKYLHKHNIYKLRNKRNEIIDDEILTDVASIYLGLGKLSLNGCTNQKQQVIHKNNNTRIITNFTNLGYLNHIQFCFVYDLICIMRKIPQTEIEKGLYPAVIERLLNTRGQYKKFLDFNFHNHSLKKDKLNKIKLTITQILSIQDNIKSHIKDFQDLYFNHFFNKFKENQTEISKIQRNSKKFLNQEINPCLAYLNNINSSNEIDNTLLKLYGIKEEIIKSEIDVSEKIKIIKKLIIKSMKRNNSRFYKAIRNLLKLNKP